jgi:DNA polymerase-3 subunit epsilon/CBS domain-containing protein
MAIRTNATPLIALDAVVIDSETTGLDPSMAWIVEIAGVRIAGGRLQSADIFRRRVNPGISIPPTATAIHHINDAAVSDAPSFIKVWPEISAFLGKAVVVGHNLGFDLAVLKRECERAGIAWTRPRTLDTRLLAQIAEPHLAGYTLDSLASWLGVEIADRHSALGDSLACAEIFLALIPKLRESGIRTLAEAEQACNALTDLLDEQHRIGWIVSVEAPRSFEAEQVFQRIDSYPYRHRVRDVMRLPVQFTAPNCSLHEALTRMINERISSLYVSTLRADENQLQASVAGIITERDVLRALAQDGTAALDFPVERYMSKPLATVPADAFIYRAIGRMSRLGIRHLAAVDEIGHIVGALSARDLLRLRASEAVSLGDEIGRSDDVHKLAAAWARLPRVAKALVQEGLSGRDIAAVISRELGALTRQAAVLAEKRMREAGKGDPPCRYAVAVLGSAGRGESLLAMDQDNALVFADGEPDGPEDRWFGEFGAHLADILHEVGVPYCRGGVMASNPQWRGSVATWQERINDWVQRSDPADLLSVDIFFDLRGVSGDLGLANRLRADAFDIAKGQAAFAKLLVESAGATEHGLNFLGRFRTESGRINLKKTGLFGIVTAARALAICHHVVERSTPERLAGIKVLGIGSAHDLEALIEAQGVFLDLLVAQQIKDIEQGVPASNAVVIKELSSHDRARLRSSLEAVRHLDDIAHDLIF